LVPGVLRTGIHFYFQGFDHFLDEFLKLIVATLAHKSDSGNVNISERVMSIGT
jgi:hypothetical protein